MTTGVGDVRRTAAAVAVAVGVLSMTGCGGESEDDGAAATESESAETSASPTEEPTPTDTEDTDETEDADDADETEDAGSDASDPGPAPDGAVIASGASTQFPDEVGEWELPDGSSGPASIYSRDDGTLVSATFLPGSDYAAISAEVSTEETPAGTGVCGANDGGTSHLCYLETADGVVSISADAPSVPLPDVVTFANQLTEELGTS